MARHVFFSFRYERDIMPDARLEVFGQDFNPQAYAICGSDMMIKGQDIEHIAFGDSFTEDHFPGKTFDYMLANPPLGVEWKPEADFINHSIITHRRRSILKKAVT